MTKLGKRTRRAFNAEFKQQDFVRYLCEPAQTVDPQSPACIARAERHFLKQPEHPVAPADAAAFLRALCLLAHEGFAADEHFWHQSFRIKNTTHRRLAMPGR